MKSEDVLGKRGRQGEDEGEGEHGPRSTGVVRRWRERARGARCWSGNRCRYCVDILLPPGTHSRRGHARELEKKAGLFACGAREWLGGWPVRPGRTVQRRQGGPIAARSWDAARAIPRRRVTLLAAASGAVSVAVRTWVGREQLCGMNLGENGSNPAAVTYGQER